MQISDSRSTVLTQLLKEIEDVRPHDQALIAVDGFDGAGKTHLSGELAAVSRVRGRRPIVTVSIDGFHRPRSERRAAGTGPEGFYSGSYAYDLFYAQVIESLRTRGTIKTAVWDVARDEPVDAPEISVPLDAIVLVDGIFLQRPELREIWDAAVWVHAPFEVSVPRGNARFSGNHDPDPESPENHRYVGGQRLYLTLARPAERATWVWNNEVLDEPSLRRNPERRHSTT